MNTDEPRKESDENLSALQQTNIRLQLLARDLQFTLASIKRLERKALAGRMRRSDQ